MTRLLSISVFVLAPFALAGAALGAEGSGWSYEGDTGPDHWATLSDEYALCASGKMQSPIDLAHSNARGDAAMFTDYRPGDLTILNNGHTIQANIPGGSKLTSGTMQFDLLQVHFHTPSEEAVNGERFPMVAHLVHSDSEGRLAVLGVLFREGQSNSELQKIIDAAPETATAAAQVAGVRFDPNGLLPDDLSVYRFQGSLTTPPCSEGVNWHVAQTPVSASVGQLAALEAIMGGNARPLQPLNGRLLVAPTK